MDIFYIIRYINENHLTAEFNRFSNRNAKEPIELTLIKFFNERCRP